MKFGATEVKILLIVLMLIAVACGVVFFFYPGGPAQTEMEERLNNRLISFDGERLVYDVYFNRLKIGESVLEFHGEKRLNGRDTYRITFTTKTPGFEDAEDIYADKETFLPLRVSRSIKKLGAFSTTIQEEYDQAAFKVIIKKQSTFSSKEFAIQKDEPISNAIVLPYYYRTRPDIAKGESFKVTLPTVDFDVVLEGREVVATPLGVRPVYVFVSVPSKFTFWLSADKRRIPLKIEGHTALGHSLIIKSIETD